MKKHNFNAGPSILADEVIQNAAKAIVDFNGSGLSLLSISHRTKDFENVMAEADALFREMLDIPDNYKILFIQGGGTLNGTYQYLDDGSVGVIFDYNGEELRYACIFTWTDEGELLMVAISDVEGADGIYFVQ